MTDEEISNFEFRISNFTPTHPSSQGSVVGKSEVGRGEKENRLPVGERFSGGKGGKSEIRNSKFEIGCMGGRQ